MTPDVVMQWTLAVFIMLMSGLLLGCFILVFRELFRHWRDG